MYQFMDHAVFLAATFFVSAAFFYVLWRVYCFAKADGDFTLLRQGPARGSVVKDKVVWIIGASQGIGEALAHEFASLGAKLILSSRRPSELERVKAALSGKNMPHMVVILPLDLTAGTNAIREAVEDAEAAFDGAGVDFLIHNAASPRIKLAALEMPDDVVKDTFEVNVYAPIVLTQLLVPAMVRRGHGHIVVVSSAAGKVPSPGQSIYAASKHAVNGYFHSLRSEVLHKGINVTVVCPGPINATRLSEEQPANTERRLSVKRCAELIAIATTHNLKEAWISYHPVLLLMYIMQYVPAIGYAILDRIGPKRVPALKGGGSGYSTSLLFGQTKKFK